MYTWQSTSGSPQRRSCSTSATKATFEASVSVANMDSPKKAAPRERPYSPPTSVRPFQASTEWATPRRWSSV